MRLDGFGRQNRLDHADPYLEMPREGSNAPIGPDRLRGRMAGASYDATASGRIRFSFSPSARLVDQAHQAVRSKHPLPFNNHGLGHVQPLLDLFIGKALGGQQSDVGP